MELKNPSMDKGDNLQEEKFQSHRSNRDMHVVDLSSDNFNHCPSFENEILQSTNENENVINCDADDQKPEILDFKIFIGTSIRQTDPSSVSSNFHSSESTSAVCSYSSNPESQYKSIDGFGQFSQQSQPEHEPTRRSKKSVRFEQGTIFIERDMNSRFWKEFSERRLRRRQLKQERQIRNQERPITLFDFMRMIFSSKKVRDSRSKENRNEEGKTNVGGNDYEIVEEVQTNSTTFGENKSEQFSGNNMKVLLTTATNNNIHDVNNALWKKNENESKNSLQQEISINGKLRRQSRVNKFINSVRCWWSRKAKTPVIVD